MDVKHLRVDEYRDRYVAQFGPLGPKQRSGCYLPTVAQAGGAASSASRPGTASRPTLPWSSEQLRGKHASITFTAKKQHFKRMENYRQRLAPSLKPKPTGTSSLPVLAFRSIHYDGSEPHGHGEHHWPTQAATQSGDHGNVAVAPAAPVSHGAAGLRRPMTTDGLLSAVKGSRADTTWSRRFLGRPGTSGHIASGPLEFTLRGEKENDSNSTWQALVACSKDTDSPRSIRRYSTGGDRIFREHAVSIATIPGERQHLKMPSPSMDEECPEEIFDWMSSTLASLPSKQSAAPLHSRPRSSPRNLAHHLPQVGHQHTGSRRSRTNSKVCSRANSKDRASDRSHGEDEVETAYNSMAVLDDGDDSFATLEEGHGHAYTHSHDGHGHVHGHPHGHGHMHSKEAPIEEVEEAVLRSTFNRFKSLHTNDVKKAILPEVIRHLGHAPAPTYKVQQLANEVEADFSGFDFHDFRSFVHRFAKYERRRLREVFDEVIEKRGSQDSSGRIAIAQLPEIIAAVNSSPPAYAALTEAITKARSTATASMPGGDDQATTLSFDEVARIQGIYRHCEGFTAEELRAIRTSFMAVAEADGANGKVNGATNSFKVAAVVRQIPRHRLGHVLAEFGGPRLLTVARRLARVAVAGRYWDDAEEFGIHEHHDESMIHVSLAETLLWARHLREAETEVYSEVFERFATTSTSASGATRTEGKFIATSMLHEVIRDLGYSLPSRTITEVLRDTLESSGREKTGEVDFICFANLMLVIGAREGFSLRELDEFEQTFERFDDNYNGEVEYVDLCDMLRYMGYSTNMEDVSDLIAEVDASTPQGVEAALSPLSTQGKSLPFNGFLRFMRLHREEELKKIWLFFDQEENDGEPGGIRLQTAELALASLGYAEVHKQMLEPSPAPSPKNRRASLTTLHLVTDKVYSFDDICDLVDRSRAACVAQQRRCAGFSKTELDHFRRVFDGHTNGSGLLDLSNLAMTLLELGFQAASPDDKQLLIVETEKARVAAAAVGVEDVGEPNSALCFWVLVQLLRVLYARDDRHVLDREARSIELTRFSTNEVDQFRDVFSNWFNKDRAFADDTKRKSHVRPSLLVMRSEERKDLSKDCLRRLLRSLGVTLLPEQRNKLERKIDDLNTSGRVDFADFLKMMRWMLDTNFADINGRTNSVRGT